MLHTHMLPPKPTPLATATAARKAKATVTCTTRVEKALLYTQGCLGVLDAHSCGSPCLICILWCTAFCSHRMTLPSQEHAVAT